MRHSARIIALFFICLVFAVFFVVAYTPTHATIDTTGVDEAGGETLGTNPKTRSSHVTVSVRDLIPPDIPILVSPSNGATLTSKRVTFAWETGFDAHGIGKYQLYLDGSLLFDSITPPNKTDPLYTYTEKEGDSTLVMKNDIAEGSHTWKVRAFDANGNDTNSATWSFTIDATAPTLIVTSVGDQTVSVSAQDTTTIPTSPIALTKNQPVLSGTSEASASITLSVILPDATSTSYTTTVSSSKTWSITLGTLPYFQTIKLQISAKDSAGNQALIDSIPIRLTYPTITLPPVVGKIVPLPSEITITPSEVIKEDIKKIVTPYIPEPVEEVVDVVIPHANSWVGFLLPLARLLTVIWLTGVSAWGLTLQFLERSMHAIGLAPLFHTPPLPIHADGIVFDAYTKTPIPFALLTVFSHTNGTLKQVEEVVSREDGTYETLHLKRAGSYTIVPTHLDYDFNVEEIVRRFSNVGGVYKGQELTSDACDWNKHDGDITSSTLPADDNGIECINDALLVHQYIPMVRKAHVRPWHTILARFATLPNPVLNSVIAVMGLIALWSPTPWNVGMFLVYGAVAVKRTMWG